MSGSLIFNSGTGGGGGSPVPTTYIQASHSINHVFSAVNTPEPIPINSNDELVGGITHPTGVGNTEVTVTGSGVYVIAAQPQVLAQAAGNFRMYLQTNTGGGFVDVANSNVELTLPNNQADVIPLITVLSLGASEIVRLMGVVTNVGVILETVAPPSEPLVPAIIFTMWRQF